MSASKAISKAISKTKTKVKPKKPPKKMDDMEAILKSMSAKEKKEFLESMGFQNKEMMRSYYKKGGYLGKGKTMKKKGGKVSGAPHNRLY